MSKFHDTDRQSTAVRLAAVEAAQAATDKRLAEIEAKLAKKGGGA